MYRYIDNVEQLISKVANEEKPNIDATINLLTDANLKKAFHLCFWG